MMMSREQGGDRYTYRTHKMNIETQKRLLLLKEIRSALEETGLPARHLEVEITESMAIKNPQQTIEKLTRLRAMGVKTSMDDFGTGYSSLSQLQTLPLDTLKVDQAFVRCIELDSTTNKSGTYANTAIANAIIAMSHSLGLRVIAEGVETAEQCQFLKSHDSELLQGYLFSKPVEAMEMEALLLHQQNNDNLNWQKYLHSQTNSIPLFSRKKIHY